MILPVARRALHFFTPPPRASARLQRVGLRGITTTTTICPHAAADDA
jgi:hypothetical protein